MCLADRAEYIAFVPGDVVPRSDLAEDADGIGFGLLDERLRNLFLAHRRDLFRVERLRVETAAGDDRHARLRGNLAQEIDVASHVGMTTVHDAADAFALRDRHLLR